MSNRRRTPADRSHPGPSSPSTGTRARVEGRSYALLSRLHALPRWTVPVLTVLLVFVGLYAGPVLGGLCLLVLAVFLCWLAYLAWPRLSSSGRLVRTLVLGLLTGVAVARLLGVWE